jgi:hypothetical protein
LSIKPTFSFIADETFSRGEYILAKRDPALLPIELLSFDVKATDMAVEVIWQTASETNNDFFTIQRSADGFAWENIAYVDGAGDSFVSLSYEYIDENPLNGVAYYRLMQTDFNGDFEIFDAMAVEFVSNSTFEMSVYPNPVVDFVTVNTVPDGQNLLLMNQSGQILFNQVVFEMNTNVNMENLPAGNYFISLVDANGNKTTQMIIKK